MLGFPAGKPRHASLRSRALRAKLLGFPSGQPPPQLASLVGSTPPGVSNVAGAALWTLDYLLSAAQVGISRIFFHQGIGFKYNLIQPVTLTRSKVDGSPLQTPLPPHVQPQYYAAVIAAEAIGPKGNTRISELSIGDGRVAGYAFYEGSKLSRAVIINSLAFFKGSSAGSRQSVHVNLSFAGGSYGAPKSITVKRLDIPHADDETGLTWGGVTYESADARPRGTANVTTVNVANGFDIRATEAVLVTFNN
ncbi:hypothetical protein D9611_001646 [Ephemerocybe angulata]|uniref:Beta-glucuronidase C-terminal domain-containing protein n=1 Tax=Ephemerocybe angulata TaxID=980116 RepID=A0A8H5FM10_9AGAR|nr:hypothetical protein D9611_001646 [Tulosesus angulatus]